MAYKEVSRVDVIEVIRRWQEGNSQRHIALGTGLSSTLVSGLALPLRILPSENLLISLPPLGRAAPELEPGGGVSRAAPAG